MNVVFFSKDNVIALSLAVVFTLLFASTFSHFLFTDSWFYLTVAQGVRDYGIPVFKYLPFNVHPPFLMYSVAVVNLLVNNIYLAGELTILLFAFLSVVLMYWVSRFYFDKFYSVVTTTLAAGSFSFWWSANEITMDMLLIFFYLLAIHFVLRMRSNFSGINLIGLGIVLGLATLTKILGALLAIIVLAYVIFCIWKRNPPYKSIKKCGLLLLSFFATLLPFLIYKLLNGFDLYITQQFRNNILTYSWGPQDQLVRGLSFYLFNHLLEIISPILILLFIWGVIVLVRKGELKKFDLILVILLIVFTATVFSKAREPHYVYHLIPLLVLVSVYGLSQLMTLQFLFLTPNLKKAIVLFLILLVVLPTYLTISSRSSGPENWNVWSDLKQIAGNETVLAYFTYEGADVLGNVTTVPINESENIYSKLAKGFSSILLLPDQNYSELPVKLTLIKSYIDCNCGIYRAINNLSEGSFFSVVDSQDKPLSQVLITATILNEQIINVFDPLLIAGFYNSQFLSSEQYLRQFNYPLSLYLNYSNENGVAYLNDHFTDENGTQISPQFTKGVMFLYKPCYEQVSVPFVFVIAGDQLRMAQCTDESLTNCSFITKIKMQPKPCWLSGSPLINPYR